MSSGGKLQLAFRGPQDAYLTGRPQTTFFKAVYKRYTNFAKECVWAPFDGNPRAGGKSIATIERQGDLVQEVFITAEMTVTEGNLQGGIPSPDIAWAAEHLIDTVDLTIGQQLIDRHYKRWWRLYSELYMDDAKKAQYSKLTSPDSPGTCKIYLPLIFFFNRNAGLALPLVAIPNQQVRLVFNWSTAANEEIWDSGNTYAVDAASIKCWVNYIYLDDDERKIMSNRDQSYLIEQLQFSGGVPINATSATGATGSVQRVPLEFKHPIKEIYWCLPRGNSSSNLTTKDTNLCELVTIGETEPHLSGGTVRYDLSVGSIFASETTDGPLQSLSVEINKSKIVEEQESKYFNQVQPFQYHSGCPPPGVYSYSFATNPESTSPTGSCNFSRIQEAACYVRTKALAATNNTIMEIYATNFNVLDIKKGFTSLAFSS